jgi:hypothetical protein
MKKQAFLLITILGLLATFFNACSKNNDTPGNDYYIRFKQDGVQKEYRAAIVADMPDTATQGMYGMLITGLKELSASEQISVGVFDYTHQPIKTNQDYQMRYDFEPGGGIDILSHITYNQAGDAHSSSVSVQDNRYESAHITLTEITDKYVKGVFSGKILKDPTENSPEVLYNITDGEFYAMRLQNGSTVNPEAGGSGGSGTDFAEFTIENKNIRIDEATSIYASAFINFSPSSVIPGVSQCTIGATSNLLAVPFYNLLFSFGDFAPLEGKTYTINSTSNTSIWLSLLFTLQFKEVAGSYFYYMKDSAPGSQTSVTITFTKFSNKKGETVEGTFSATNLIKTTQIATTLAENINLTNGKFRLTLY